MLFHLDLILFFLFHIWATSLSSALFLSFFSFNKIALSWTEMQKKKLNILLSCDLKEKQSSDLTFVFF